MADAKIKVAVDANEAAKQIKSVGDALLGTAKSAGATDDEVKLLQQALQKAADTAAKSKAPYDVLKDAVAALAKAQKEGADTAKIQAAQAAVTAAAIANQADQEKKAEKQADAYKDALHNMAAGMGGAVGQSVAFIASLKNSYKEGGAATAALVGLTGALNVLAGGFNFVADSIKSNASENDVAAQAIVGSYKHVEDTVGNLAASLAEGLAPAFAGIAQIIVPLINDLKAWIQEGNKSGEMAQYMAQAFFVVVDVLRTLTTVTNEVRTTFNELQWQIGSITDKEYAAFLKSIDDTDKAFQKVEDSIKKLQTNLATGGTGIAKAMAEEGQWAQENFRIIDELKNQLVAAEGKSASERIAIIKKFHQDNLTIITERKEIEQQIGELIRSEQMKGLQARSAAAKVAADEEKKLREDMAATMLELEQETQDQLAELKSEGAAKIQEENEVGLEEVKKFQEDRLASLIEDAQFRAETEQELADRLMEINRIVRDDESFSVEQRKAATLALADFYRSQNEKMRQEAKATSDEQIKKAKETETKVSNSMLSMAKTLLNTQMSMKEKAGAIFDEMSKLIIDAVVQQANAVVINAQKSAAAKIAAANASIAADATEKTVAAGMIPVEVAKSHAGLGPLGIGLAAIALSFFMGMIKTKIGLKEGGSIDGAVPGLGREDGSATVDLTSKEFVMNERGRAAFGDEALNYANTTGQNPYSGNGGSSAPIFNININASSGPGQDADAYWRPLIPELIKSVNDFVRRRGGYLLASELRT